VTETATDAPLAVYALRLADDNMINAQRLSEYITHAPELEEELAIANIALDILGVAQQLYGFAASLDGRGRSADDLAFLRNEREYTNCLLVEQPHHDFAEVMARQLFFDLFQTGLWPALAQSQDDTLAGVAAKAAKEARYHLRHSAAWVVRLGDGTEESARRMQAAVDALWRFTGELTEDDGLDLDAFASFGVAAPSLRRAWLDGVSAVFLEAKLRTPQDPYQATGGRSGRHSEHLGHLLAEMQYMQRAFPAMEW